MTKGIILAGGKGARLYPITFPVCKQLLPVYDKPMIYYPLSILMLAGIKKILLISTPNDIDKFKDVFGDGSRLGISITYKVQVQPNGLSEALILGEDFIGKDNVCLVLGDNILYGSGLTSILENAKKRVEKEGGAHVFGYYVNDPERFGVATFDKNHKVVSIQEKPLHPQSNYAVLGLYFYDNKGASFAKKIRPSARGELEITSLNRQYLKAGKLKISVLGRGFAWFDTGTHDSLQEAGDFVKTIEKRTGLKIGCIEEIAFNKGYITRKELLSLAEPLKKSGYGKYLSMVADDQIISSAKIN
jgi:glucose-1-phosphate thymidylyltransferase